MKKEKVKKGEIKNLTEKGKKHYEVEESKEVRCNADEKDGIKKKKE